MGGFVVHEHEEEMMSEELKDNPSVSYQLRITRQRPNPKYDPNYRMSTTGQMFLESEALSVTVTAEQFEAIRKAVLEKF